MLDLLAMEWIVQVANFTVAFWANFLIHSTIIIFAGFLASYVLRDKGADLQSAILKTTLIAVLLSPGVKIVYHSCNWTYFTLDLPHVYHNQSPKSKLPESVNSQPLIAADKHSQLIEHELAQDKKENPAANTVNRVDNSPVSVSYPSHSNALLSFSYIIVAILWIITAIYFIARLCLFHLQIVHLRRTARPAGSIIVQKFNSIAQRIGVASPEVRIHELIKSPILTGFFRPLILLPAPRDGYHICQEIIIHEIAHIKRHDIVWNLLARLSIALFPFQPLLRFLAKNIEQSNENVCDDYAVSFGGNRSAFAHELVSIAAYSQPYFCTGGSKLGIVSNRSCLNNRISRILDRTRDVYITTKYSVVTAIVLAHVVVASITGFIGFNVRTIYAFTDYSQKTLIDKAATIEINSKSNTGNVQQKSSYPVQPQQPSSKKEQNNQKQTQQPGTIDTIKLPHFKTLSHSKPKDDVPHDYPYINEAVIELSSLQGSEFIPKDTKVETTLHYGFKSKTNPLIQSSVEYSNFRGTLPLAYVWGERLRPPENLGRYLTGLKEALLKWTDITVEMEKPVWLNSPRLHTMPFVFVTTDKSFDLSTEEKKNVKKYLLNGGFIVLENATSHIEGAQAEQSLKNMMYDALGSLARFEPISNDNFLYHCFFHFDDGPPLGAELEAYETNTAKTWNLRTGEKSGKMSKQVYFLEGIWIQDRLVGVYSNKGYAVKWNIASDELVISKLSKYPNYTRRNPEFDSIEPQLKMGVNFVVYALRKKGVTM